MVLTNPSQGVTRATMGGPGSAAVGRGGALQTATKPKTNPLAQQVMAQPPPQPQGYQELQGLFNTLLPMAGPAIANSNAQIGNYQNMLGQLFAGQQYQGGLLQQQGQNQLANLGLSQEALQNQQGILQRQQGLLPQQNALQEQLYGLAKEGLQANRQQLGQLNSLNQQDLASQYAEVGRNHSNSLADLANQRRNFTGQLAAQGAMVSPGAQQGYDTLNRQGATLQEQLASAFGGLSRQGQRSDIGYQGQLGDIGRAERQQDINRSQYGLNYGEQQAQLADQKKNLDLVAKQHGLSKEEIENRTNQALAQLGLTNVLSAGQIYSSLINAQQGKFDAITPILGAIYQYIGLRPVASG